MTVYLQTILTSLLALVLLHEVLSYQKKAMGNVTLQIVKKIP